MARILTDIIVVIVVLGVVIFVHEFGHFVAAKSFGVRVPVYSFGFPPRLFGIKKGHFSFGRLKDDDPSATDYRVSLLLFGGYVRMAGEDPTQVHGEDPGEFLSHPRWQRFIVMAMGPAMNIFLAIGLLAGLYMVQYVQPAYESQAVRIGDVAANSPAAKAGLKPGDLVLKFDGQKNPSWQDVELQILTMVGEQVPLVVQRGSAIEHVAITPVAKGSSRIGYAGWMPFMPAIIHKVEAGLPASHAGLKAGDEIVGINGHTTYYYPTLIKDIAGSKGKPVTLTIRRGATVFETQLQPVYTTVMGETKWQVGIMFPRDIIVSKLPLGKAFMASLNANFESLAVTIEALGKILTRQMSTRSLSGPIGIAQLSGQAYRAGLADLLTFMSFISLQLGIINLFPLPVLDGGGIVTLAIEGVMRRDLSLAVKERLAQVGIVLILALTIFAVYNDIMKTVHPY